MPSDRLVGRKARVVMQVHAEAAEIYPKLQRLEILIDAYTDGTDRRAHAQAWAIKIVPGRLEVVPFGLREVAGPDVGWHAPARGKPILTANPIRTREEAETVLAVWAMKTFGENAHAVRRRVEVSSPIRGAKKAVRNSWSDHVRLGILSIAVGVVVALASRDFLGFVIAGACLYSGGNLLFGAIGGSDKFSKPNR